MKLLSLQAILAFSLLLVVGSAGYSQEPAPEESYATGTEFQVDLAWFRTDNIKLNRLEVYYRIFNNDLQFKRVENAYQANYEISIIAYDNKGRPVDSRSRKKSFSLASYDRTVSEKDYRASQINMILPPGKYKIECTLRDKNGNGRARKALKTNLTGFDNDNPQMSGIEFVQTADSAVLDSLFLKGNRTIIPSVGREYGGDSAAVLLYYQEIYQGKGKREDIKIETQILDAKHDVVYRDTLTSTFSEGAICQLRQASLSGMKAGMYILEVILRGRREKIVDDMKETFWINWSPEALINNDFEAAVQQLKYIAAPAEMRKIENAPTPEEKLKQWNEFWLSRDPTPGTAENEAKKDYYRRIEIANQRYTVMKKEGWLADRGMIFITYGEPDQIEEYPFELSQKAYQVWYYYSSGNARKFVFVDEWGDGDYRLQYPYDGALK